jgi:multiple sugar transport system ATP-binding protein
MNGGKIEQIGSPNDVYHHPKTRFVAGFIGSPAMNMVRCELEETAGALRVRLNGEIGFPVPQERVARYRPHVGKKLLLGLRPEHLTEMRATTSPSQCPFEVNVDVIEPLGMETLVFFTINRTELCARTNPYAGIQAGKRAQLLADLRYMHLIDEETGRVL